MEQFKIPIEYHEMFKDLQWMARRYADHRSTFAPSIVNQITDKLIAGGVDLNNCDGTLYAADGMFGTWENGRFVSYKIGDERKRKAP